MEETQYLQHYRRTSVPMQSYQPSQQAQQPLINSGTGGIRRTISRLSKRSYISNLSAINRKNLTRFGGSKITFLVFNSLFTFSGLSILLLSTFTWVNNYMYAPFIKLLRLDLLILVTSVSGFMSIVGFLGFLGAFTHRKQILSIYNVLLWPALIAIIVIGYLTFKYVNATDFEAIMSDRWENFNYEKLLVQDTFSCCGFYSEFDRTWVDDQCGNSVSGTQGCHDPFIGFVSSVLRMVYIFAFSLIPLVLVTFIVGMGGREDLFLERDLQ